jgi:RHS repeat-associated protein
MAATNLSQAVAGNTFNGDNAMTKFNGTSMSYDANGNLTSDGTNTYTWDARNHLTAISGAVTASFSYDALGRRVSKTINGTATSFLYDGLNPVQEIQSGSPSANLLTGLNIDEYFQRTDSAGARDFLSDTLGSTLALADSSGAIQTSYTYEPFGNTTVSGASSTNSFQFTGRENDATGLYYYRARYYSAMYQRFVAQDPIELQGGPNLYEYTVDDPADFRDPNGNQFISAILVGAAAGAIAGGISGFFDAGPCASFGQRLGGALYGAGGGAILGGGIAAVGIGELAGAAVEGLAGGASGVAGGIGGGIGTILTDGAEGFVPTVFKGALGGFSEAGFDAATGGGSGGSPCGCQ